MEIKHLQSNHLYPDLVNLEIRHPDKKRWKQTLCPFKHCSVIQKFAHRTNFVGNKRVRINEVRMYFHYKNEHYERLQHIIGTH